MLGSESAIEGASAVSDDGRIALVDAESSNIVAIMKQRQRACSACFSITSSDVVDPSVEISVSVSKQTAVKLKLSFFGTTTLTNPELRAEMTG